MDGPPEIHDAVRVDARGRPTFDKVLKGMTILREAGVSFSVLMVVDEETIQLGARRLYEFFCELNLDNVGLIAVKPSNLAKACNGTTVDHYIDPKRFNSFLADIYDLCYTNSCSNIKIREIEGIRNQVIGSESVMCTLAGDCFGQYYSVEPNGDVAHCDLYVDDYDYTLGNILDSDFTQIGSSGKLNVLKQRRAADITRMRNCSAFDICNGWCPHEKYLASRHDSLNSNVCCGLLPLIEHVKSHLEDSQSVSLNK